MKKFIHLIFWTTVIFSQVNSTDIDQKIIKATFNDEFDKAKELIQLEIEKQPNHPKYHFMMSAMYFQKINANNDSKNSRIALEKYALKAIEVAEELNEDDIEIKFYLGAAYGYLGRYYGMDGSWFSAFRYGKKGKNYLEEVIEEDPTYYDAYLGLGIFNYYAGRLGGIIKSISWLLGMSGDIEKGLKYLELSREKGDLSKDETYFFLIDSYINFEIDYTKAISLSKEFLKRNPNNSWAINSLLGIYDNTYQYDKIKPLVENIHSIQANRLALYYDRDKNIDYFIDNYEWLKMNSIDSNIIVYYYGLNLWSANKDALFSEIYNSLDKDFWVYKTLQNHVKKNKKDYNKVTDFRKKVLFLTTIEAADKIIVPTLETNDFEIVSLYYQAIIHLKLKDTVKAEKALVSYIRAYPNQFRAYLNLFSLYKYNIFPTENVIAFIDLVDDFDNDYLISLCEQLEEKYKL